jgi:capsular polysaccharide biosynthesis protein
VFGRCDAKKRRWRNVYDLLLRLNATGIRVEYFTSLRSLSVQQQAALFGGTDLLLSIHGANLANSFFLPRNATFVHISAEKQAYFMEFAEKLKGVRALGVAGYIDPLDRFNAPIHRDMLAAPADIFNALRQIGIEIEDRNLRDDSGTASCVPPPK